MRKTITVLLLIVAVLLPFVVFDVLPVIGDPESAPNTHVSDYYIEHAIDECNSPNMVTAVIVDCPAKTENPASHFDQENTGQGRQTSVQDGQ